MSPMMRIEYFGMKVVLLLAALAVLVTPGLRAEDEEEEDGAPEEAVGERLFLETRFAQFFFANNTGINDPLPAGDPVMNVTKKAVGGDLPGPFAGQSMNCRACHLVDEHALSVGGTMRTYADFARRSPIPARDDGLTSAPRNSPALVNASLPREPANPFVMLHFDGEFRTLADLVKATLTGRNYGWKPSEFNQAVKHIADVIRRDNGQDALGKEFGGSYREILSGHHEDYELEGKFAVDVGRASDRQILDTVARLIAAYVRALRFADASPFDVFLRKNGLPTRPKGKESGAAFGRRLLEAVENLSSVQFVTDPADGHFASHAQEFKFGATELEGMKLFLSQQDFAPLGRAGNCVACHAPPKFTDFRFHNTGITQRGYDALHGSGAFLGLAVPSHGERRNAPELFLVPSPKHPDYAGPFRAVPSGSDSSLVDLGVWNILLHPDHKRVQRVIKKTLLAGQKGKVSRDELLDRALAAFKTPGLRDLGHSGPYMHDGSIDTLEEVVLFYVEAAGLVNGSQMRNPAPEVGAITLVGGDAAAIAAFLRSLNEDYE